MGHRHGDEPRLHGQRVARFRAGNPRIMGLQQAWGHEALFDYVDRYMQIESKHTWTRSWNPFAERMWDRYRSSY